MDSPLAVGGHNSANRDPIGKQVSPGHAGPLSSAFRGCLLGELSASDAQAESTLQPGAAAIEHAVASKPNSFNSAQPASAQFEAAAVSPSMEMGTAENAPGPQSVTAADLKTQSLKTPVASVVVASRSVVSSRAKSSSDAKPHPSGRHDLAQASQDASNLPVPGALGLTAPTIPSVSAGGEAQAPAINDTLSADLIAVQTEAQSRLPRQDLVQARGVSHVSVESSLETNAVAPGYDLTPISMSGASPTPIISESKTARQFGSASDSTQTVGARSSVDAALPAASGDSNSRPVSFEAIMDVTEPVSDSSIGTKLDASSGAATPEARSAGAAQILSSAAAVEGHAHPVEARSPNVMNGNLTSTGPDKVSQNATKTFNFDAPNRLESWTEDRSSFNARLADSSTVGVVPGKDSSPNSALKGLGSTSKAAATAGQAADSQTQNAVSANPALQSSQGADEQPANVPAEALPAPSSAIPKTAKVSPTDTNLRTGPPSRTVAARMAPADPSSFGPATGVFPPASEFRHAESSAENGTAKLHGALSDPFPQLDRSPEQSTRLLQTSPREVRVGLHDSSLGWVEIKTQLSAGEVTASFNTGSQAAHASLAAELPHLAEYLADRQIGVHAFEVDPGHTSGGGHQGPSNGEGNSQGDAQGNGQPRLSREPDAPPSFGGANESHRVNSSGISTTGWEPRGVEAGKSRIDLRV